MVFFHISYHAASIDGQNQLIWIGAIGSLYDHRHFRIRRQGIRTNGIVKARYTGRFHWYLTFSYEDQGKEYQQRQCVFRTAYDKIQEGAIVSVAYWPDDPQEAVLVNSEVWPLLRSLTILFSALSFAFVFLVIVGGFLLLVIP